MSFKQTLKGTLLPSIELKTLADLDTSSATAANDNIVMIAKKSQPTTAQKMGANKPFVKIGGHIVSKIETLTIDETGFLPKVSMVFVDELGEFSGYYFPKTNLIMNLYLKAGSDKFKPIRCDFLITSMKAIPSSYSGESRSAGSGTAYIVKGELYIPLIYKQDPVSYPNMSSKEALIAISKELGLGFVENECSPNDKMTWVNSNRSYSDFIQEIASHAYQSDDSFFTAFIDKYYYLNFIEVNTQLLIEDMQDTFITSSNAMMKDMNQSSEDKDEVRAKLEDEVIPNFLTTEMDKKGLSNFIFSLGLNSDHGGILRDHGYKKQIYYYDHTKNESDPAKKFTDFYIEPLKSEDRDETEFMVAQEEALVSQPTSKWMNIDYGNTHPQWYASRLLNHHNMLELNKLQLKASTRNINFQVVKGSVVPIYVTVQQAEKLFKASPRLNNKDESEEEIPDEDLNKELPDEQLTGFYYLIGTKYYYDSLSPNLLYTDLYLARREWRPSKITE